MSQKNSLHDKTLKARVSRLTAGDLQVDDIAKLYIGKRGSSYGRKSFRELADFMAHPDLRVRGPVTDRIRDRGVPNVFSYANDDFKEMSFR